MLDLVVSPHMDGADKTEQLTTVKGNPTTMSCLVSGQPVPRISWLKDGKAIDHGESRGKILQILNTDMSDIGRYSCVASNEAGSVSKHFILNVLGELTFSLLSSICSKPCLHLWSFDI